MHVVLFTDADVFAGTESHMLELARGLREMGLHVSIACPAAGPLAQKAKGGLIDWAAVRTLRRLLKSNVVDVIHAHNGRTALSAALAVRLARRGRCVATQHFLEPNHASQKGPKAVITHLAHAWVNRSTHHYIAISDAVRQAMLERSTAVKNKIPTIANGIAEPDESSLKPAAKMREEIGIASDAPLIVCAARLEREKDVTSLIAAMPEVVTAHPATVCVVAGHGSQQAILQQQIDDLGVGEAVRLLGFRTDALSLMWAADIFVLPSLAEPFGLVLLEAMSLGKPVVATSAGGPLEIVVAGETGLLVPPAQPHELALAINQLLADPEKAIEMGRKGLERYKERFTTERMARETVAVYRKVTEYSG
jgi:glycosyltransferase involved in cell wall biosynthesis